MPPRFERRLALQPPTHSATRGSDKEMAEPFSSAEALAVGYSTRRPGLVRDPLARALHPSGLAVTQATAANSRMDEVPLDVEEKQFICCR